MAGVSFYNLPAVNPYLLKNAPNPAAAFSFRKLRPDYSGYSCKVRRASDNAEQDIGFVGSDLDTATLNSFCSGTNGFVSTWYDQQTNKNLLQSNAAYQPKIFDASNGIITVNSKPAMQFDGVNDYLLSTFSPITITDYFTFLVWNKINTFNERFILLYNNLASRDAQIGQVATNSIRTWYNSNISSIDNIGDYSTTSHLLFHHYKNDNTFSISLDGVDKVINKSLTTFNRAFTAIKLSGRGAGSSISNIHDGTVQELIIYNTDRSSQKNEIQTNIKTYYNIP